MTQSFASVSSARIKSDRQDYYKHGYAEILTRQNAHPTGKRSRYVSVNTVHF